MKNLKQLSVIILLSFACSLTTGAQNFPPNESCETVLDFSGQPGLLLVLTDGSLQFTDSFTIEFWFKLTDALQDATLLGRAGDEEWSVQYRAQANAIVFSAGAFEVGYVGEDPSLGSAITLPDADWHHVAYAYDRETWSGYLDGEEVFSGNRIFSLLPITDLFLIGGLDTGASVMMDEVRIWNHARTESEIATSMQTKLSGTEPGLAGYWDMNEQVGNTANDKSTNGNNGYLLNMDPALSWKLWDGSPACAAPHNALDFDGVNDYVSIPDAGNLNFVQEFTLEAWIYKREMGDERIIDKGIAGTTDGYSIDTYQSKIRFIGGGMNVSGSTNLNLNTWYHIAVTFSATDSVRIYVNGNLGGIFKSAGDIVSTGTPLNLGRPGAGSAAFGTYNGLMEEVRLWNIVRTRAEIQANMNRELQPQNGLVAYYKFNHGIAGGDNTADPAATQLADWSNNCNTGTLTGFSRSGNTSNWVLSSASSLKTNGILANEVELRGNDQLIHDNDTTPRLDDHTDFGMQSVCAGTVTRIFDLVAADALQMEFYGTEITGQDSLDFTVDAVEFTGNELKITVTFDPSAEGTRSATLHIYSNDCDEEDYNFSIQGTGTVIDASLSSITDTPCTYDSAGAASVSVSGGIEPYTYEWSPGDPAGEGTDSIKQLFIGDWRCMVTDVNGCQDSIDFTVNAITTLPSIFFSEPHLSRCVNDDKTELIGSPTGGTYRGPGVSGDQFDPAAAGEGTHGISYTYTEGGCADSVHQLIHVFPLPAVELNLPASLQPICLESGAISLSGGLPENGVFSGPGVEGGVLDPAVAGIGTHTLTYSFTDQNGCIASDSTTMRVDVCTGTSELSARNQSVTISPNPGKGIFVVKSEMSRGTIHIRDAFGRIVHSSVSNDHESAVSLEHVPAGVYFLQMMTASGIVTHKIIKE